MKAAPPEDHMWQALRRQRGGDGARDRIGPAEHHDVRQRQPGGREARCLIGDGGGFGSAVGALP